MEHIKSLLDAMARGFLRAMPEDERVLAAWRQVCGAQAAEHAHAEFFAAGVLHVRVDDAEWRTTLSHLRGQYCARLTQMTGVAVDGIKFSA